MRRCKRRSITSSRCRSSSSRASGALVVELPRAPGARETRWAHLLSGEPAVAEIALPVAAAPSGELVTVGEIAALKANVAELQREIAGLRTTVARLCAELGLREP